MRQKTTCRHIPALPGRRRSNPALPQDGLHRRRTVLPVTSLSLSLLFLSFCARRGRRDGRIHQGSYFSERPIGRLSALGFRAGTTRAGRRGGRQPGEAESIRGIDFERLDQSRPSGQCRTPDTERRLRANAPNRSTYPPHNQKAGPDFLQLGSGGLRGATLQFPSLSFFVVLFVYPASRPQKLITG